MIFESHAHYDDSKFDDDREELLSSMQENGIEKIINIGCSIESCKSTLELTKQYPFVYGAMGIHPSDIGDLNEDTFLWLREQVKKEKVVAVGEIGLDYYWDKEEEVQKNQRIWFRRQLELAKESNLPVIIHSRDAAADTMEIMKEAYVQGIKGVIHCFSYSKEQAQEYVKMVNEFGGQMPNAIGVPEDQLRQAAKLSVCKINIDSDLRLAMTGTIREFFNEHPDKFDPREYLKPARANIKELVRHKLRDVLGCAGKA